MHVWGAVACTSSTSAAAYTSPGSLKDVREAILKAGAWRHAPQEKEHLWQGNRTSTKTTIAIVWQQQGGEWANAPLGHRGERLSTPHSTLHSPLPTLHSPTLHSPTLHSPGVLNNIDLRYCRLGDEGKGAILDAVSGREGFKLDM